MSCPPHFRSTPLNPVRWRKTVQATRLISLREKKIMELVPILLTYVLVLTQNWFHTFTNSQSLVHRETFLTRSLISLERQPPCCQAWSWAVSLSIYLPKHIVLIWLWWAIIYSKEDSNQTNNQEGRQDLSLPTPDLKINIFTPAWKQINLVSL